MSSVSNTGDVSGAPHSRLKREVLSSLEVGAQSVAGMAPSAAMAVNVLLVYLAGARAVEGTVEHVITSEVLTRLHGLPVEVLRASDGRLVVVGQPEAPAHHHDRHAHVGAHEHSHAHAG